MVVSRGLRRLLYDDEGHQAFYDLRATGLTHHEGTVGKKGTEHADTLVDQRVHCCNEPISSPLQIMRSPTSARV